MPKKHDTTITPFPYDMQGSPREARKKEPLTSQQAQMDNCLPSVSRASNGDPYYGYEYIARLCARFMEDVYEFPELKIPSRNAPKSVELPYYIAKAIHRAEKVHPRTDIRPRTPFAALLILMRLKRFANQFVAKGPVGPHGLFLTAFMMGYKTMNGPPYKLTINDWVTVGQYLHSGAELEAHEKRVKYYLGEDVHIDVAHQLDRFEQDMMSQYGSEKSWKFRDSKSSSESTLVGLGLGLDMEKLSGHSIQSMKKSLTESSRPSPKKTVLQLHVAPPALPIKSSRKKVVKDYATGEIYYSGTPTMN